MNSTHWPEDRSDKLAGYVSGGAMSFAQIAAAINAEFGTTYSRNAAIGRAGRMGLSNPFCIKVAKKEPRPKVHREKRSEPRRAAASESMEQVKLRCVEIEPRNLTLLELTPPDCRYPYGEGSSVAFCGHPTIAASSYCASHQALTHYRPHNISEADHERRRRHFMNLNKKNNSVRAMGVPA